jgi:hypothetical protein
MPFGNRPLVSWAALLQSLGRSVAVGPTPTWSLDTLRSIESTLQGAYTTALIGGINLRAGSNHPISPIFNLSSYDDARGRTSSIQAKAVMLKHICGSG